MITLATMAIMWLYSTSTESLVIDKEVVYMASGHSQEGSGAIWAALKNHTDRESKDTTYNGAA